MGIEAEDSGSEVEEVQAEEYVPINKEVPRFVVADLCANKRQYGGKFKGNYRAMLTHVRSLYTEGQVSYDLQYMQKRYAEFQVDPAIDRDEFSQWKKRTSFLESELEAILNVLTSAEASANREKRPEPEGPHAKEGEDRLMTFNKNLKN